MDVYSGFLATAFALAGSPGPNTLSLAAVGAAYGYRRGLTFMVGLNVGMALVIAIVGSGVGATLFVIPGAAQIIAIIAALYFIYLAYKIATAPPLSAEMSAQPAPGWIPAVFVSLANPKAYAAMAAAFSGFVLAAEPIMDGLTKAALLICVIMIVNIIWLFAGAVLTPWFRRPETSRMINLGFAAALLLSVGATLLL